MKSVCRFCHMPIEMPLPADERMGKFLRVLATRACCNRCADYQRSQRDRGELLGHLGYQHACTFDESDRQPMERAARAIMLAAIRAAEEHHFLSGLEREVDEWMDNFRRDPRAARWQTQLFVKGVADIAKQTHQPVPA